MARAVFGRRRQQELGALQCGRHIPRVAAGNVQQVAVRFDGDDGFIRRRSHSLASEEAGRDADRQQQRGYERAAEETAAAERRRTFAPRAGHILVGELDEFLDLALFAEALVEFLAVARFAEYALLFFRVELVVNECVELLF